MIIFLILLTLVVIFAEIAGLLVMGMPPKDADILEAIEHHRKDIVRLSSIDSDILYIGDMPFIAKHFQFLGNYYIDDVGIIPRWYKSHKIIKKLFSNLQIKPVSSTKRKRLGI